MTVLPCRPMIECKSGRCGSTAETSAQCAHRVGGDSMTLDFGIFDHVDRNDLPLRDYYEARLKIVEAYDRAGFYGYHVAEHHATPLGMAPSPSVFLAASRSAPRDLRFGTDGLCAAALSSAAHDRGNLHARSDERRPARDRLRPWLASPIELTYYGQDPEDAATSMPRRSSSIRRGLTEKSLNFEGRRFHFKNVPMELRAAAEAASADLVWRPCARQRRARGTQGLHVVSLDPPDNARRSARFRAVWREAHGAASLPKMGLGRFIVVADSERQRWRWRAGPIRAGIELHLSVGRNGNVTHRRSAPTFRHADPSARPSPARPRR